MKRLLSILLASAVLTGCGVYSEGERTGTVSKISHKGIIFKTYEGELVMGGLRNTTSVDSAGNSVNGASRPRSKTPRGAGSEPRLYTISISSPLLGQ